NTMPKSSCGIAIAGGSGGASRTVIEHCAVENFYCGISTGMNGIDALADSNTIRETYIYNCYYGVRFMRSQNFINNIFACTINDSWVAVSSTQGTPVNILGGNYSNTSANRKRCAISAVSPFSTFTDTLGGNTFTNYRFTAVVPSPDMAMNNRTYDRAVIY